MNNPDILLAATRRKLIISAASRCFSRTGFHGTSMADITQESGLSAGQIYRHYSGKEKIVNDVIRNITECWSGFLLKNLPKQSKTDNIIDTHSSFWNEWSEEQRRLLIETYSEASRNKTARQIVNAAEQKLHEEMEMIFSVSMPDSSIYRRRQKILLLLLLTDGVVCRNFTDNSLNKEEMKRINHIFSHPPTITADFSSD